MNFGCVCVRFELIKFFTFCIFTLSSVYTCKYILRDSIHQPLVSPPFGSSNIASVIKEKQKPFGISGEAIKFVCENVKKWKFKS